MNEYQLNDITYIDISDIRKTHKEFCKGTRSNSQLLERKNITDYIYGRIEDNQLIQTEKLSRKFGSVFINKNAWTELFETPKQEYPPAPPLITDEDLIFFKDDDGKTYKVPMRGERTQEGIFFEVNAIMKVFQMNNLCYDLRNPATTYKLDTHYIIFNLQSFETLKHRQDKVSNALEGEKVSNDRKQIYLTYRGLRKVIETSRSGVGYKFQKWIDELVFYAAFGTQTQKANKLSKILNVDAEHLKAIMSKSPTAISCLYLIDIGITDNNKRVFKFGLTENIKRRFAEHIKTYGDDIKLDTFILIPLLSLSKAESDFKKCVSRYRYERGEEKELISLCEEAYINIQNIFNSISRNYCGNVQEQIAIYKHRLEKMELEVQIKLMAKDNEVKLLAKDIEIMKLKLKLAGVEV